MKKLLMIAALVCALVFALVVTAGAKTVVSSNNKDAQGDIVADVIVEYEANKHICSVDISYLATSGEEKTGKIYYTTGLWIGENKRQIEGIYLPYDFDMSQIIYFCDKADFNNDGTLAGTDLLVGTYGSGFDIYTYEAFENNTFDGTTSARKLIQAVSYSKYQDYFGANTFARADKLNSVTYNGKEPVEGTCIISPTVAKIMAGVFGGDGGNVNTVTSDFTRVIFEDRTGSLEMGQYCFTRGVITDIFFGNGKYSLHGEQAIAIQYVADNTTEYSLKTIVVSKNTAFTSGNISWRVGDYSVIVIGTESECSALYNTNCKNALKNATSVVYNPCYYGHTEAEDDGNCETAVVCSVCYAYTYKAAMEHINGESIVYESLFKDGYYYVGCINENCTVGTQEKAAALFGYVGYSASTYAEGGALVQCFKVNTAAVEAYARICGEISFGVVAALGGKDPLKLENGVACANGKAVFSKLGEINGDGTLEIAHSYFEIKVLDIPASKVDTKLILCGYAVIGAEDEARLYYLDNGESKQTVDGISFNEILENQ